MVTAAELLATDDVSAALKDLGIDDPGGATLEPFGYPFGSPATAALYRLRGEGWSRFCKVLQHVRHWPGLAQMPPQIARGLHRHLPWRVRAGALGAAGPSPRCPTGCAPRAARDRRHARRPGRGLDGGRRPRRRRRGTTGPLRPRGAPARPLERALHRPRGPRRSTLPRASRCGCTPRTPSPFRGLMPLADDGLWAHPWLAGARRPAREPARAGRPRSPRCSTGSTLRAVPPARRRQPAEPAGARRRPRDVRRHRPVLPDAARPGLRPRSAPGRARRTPAWCRPSRMPADRRRGSCRRTSRAWRRRASPAADAAVRDAFATSALLRSGFDGFLYDLLGTRRRSDRHAFDERVELSGFLVDQYRVVHADADSAAQHPRGDPGEVVGGRRRGAGGLHDVAEHHPHHHVDRGVEVLGSSGDVVRLRPARRRPPWPTPSSDSAWVVSSGSSSVSAPWVALTTA